MENFFGRFERRITENSCIKDQNRIYDPVMFLNGCYRLYLIGCLNHASSCSVKSLMGVLLYGIWFAMVFVVYWPGNPAKTGH